MSWTPHVTDHAALRFVERAMGWDVSAAVEAVGTDDSYTVLRWLSDYKGLNVARLKFDMSHGARMKRIPQNGDRDIRVAYHGVILVVRDQYVVTVLCGGMGRSQQNGLRRVRRARMRERTGSKHYA